MNKMKQKYICRECGAKGKVRWSKSHNDMIVECSNTKCGSFIQMFLDYKCNLPRETKSQDRRIMISDSKESITMFTKFREESEK